MKLYGILHRLADGKLTVMAPRMLKVSIGLGKGKDLHVHIGPTGKWLLTAGGKVTPFDSMDACQAAYQEVAATAPERKAPKKLPYFTFTRPGLNGQEPDFNAIAAHGSMPKEIDVVVGGTLDQIFRPEMQMWSTRELQCKGDGLTGERLMSLAKTDAEKALVKPGEQRFQVKPCFADGCKFSQGDNPACKPHASFFFQLVAYPLAGGTASYDTTGYAGIKALGGVLENLENSIPGEGVDGMVFTMGLRSYTPRKGSGVAYHATLRPAKTLLAESSHRS
jgi:Recombination directionality factor-like